MLDWQPMLEEDGVNHGDPSDLIVKLNVGIINFLLCDRMAASAAPGFPAALRPPFILGNLYRIYNRTGRPGNSDGKKGSLLVVYDGHPTYNNNNAHKNYNRNAPYNFHPHNNNNNNNNNDNNNDKNPPPEFFYDFIEVSDGIRDEGGIHSLYVDHPTYGVSGRYVGPLLPGEHQCSHLDCLKLAPYTCGRCLSAYYCGPEHQRADWNRHKRECRALSAKAGGRRKSQRSKQSKRSHRKTKRRN